MQQAVQLERQNAVRRGDWFLQQFQPAEIAVGRLGDESVVVHALRLARSV